MKRLGEMILAELRRRGRRARVLELQRRHERRLLLTAIVCGSLGFFLMLAVLVGLR